MYQINEFEQRQQLLDEYLGRKSCSDTVTAAVKESKGKASIAVSGGSTPKGFFQALSKKQLAWHAITITLADERWVDIDIELIVTPS